MRVLVTGGAGFLGSHLCERLLLMGHTVIALDNLFTGSKDNIEELFNSRRFEFIRHDVVNPILLEVDWIFNLACPASPVHYQYNPVKTVKTSVMGTLNMLGMAKRVKARILQASTSEVYGNPTVHPQPETYWGNVNPIGPRSCYDEGKRAAETLCMDYHRNNGVDIRIARIFNTYGPKMAPDDGRVVSNFIMQALKNEPLTMYGDGQQTRCFCYVTDMVNGLIQLMKYESPGIPDAYDPINLGSTTEISMNTLANELCTIFGQPLNLTHNPLPKDDPTRRQPDITRAKERLGWEPTVSLEDGLKATVEYFRGLGSEVWDLIEC